MTVTGIDFIAAYPDLHRLAHRRAHRVVGDNAVAEEVAQETLLAAQQRWDTVASHAEAWVSRVALNMALDVARRRKPVVPTATNGSGADPELRLDLARALASLPERQLEVVVMRVLLDLAEADVAAELGISKGSVKRHLSRALDRLRRHPAMEARTEPTWSWRREWTEAVEPPEGWPPRPWDHRLFVADDGAHERLAVDADGHPLLDADGDEVLSGPGFDHRLVKKRVDLDPIEPEARRLHEPDDAPAMTALLEAAGLLAVRNGHTWIGDEHLAVVLLEAGHVPDRAVTRDPARLRAAIARFYDGPLADARLRLVARRQADNWRPAAVESAVEPGLSYSLAARLERLGPGVTPGAVAADLLTKSDDYSLVATLISG